MTPLLTPEGTYLTPKVRNVDPLSVHEKGQSWHKAYTLIE
jgi:hypothetical protein